MNHAIVLFYFNLCRRLIIIHTFTLCTILSIRPQSSSSIDVLRYLNLWRRSTIPLLLNELLIWIIIVNLLFSVCEIFNILVIIHLLDLIRTHLLEVKISPKKSLIIIVLISLENLINLILLNRIIFFSLLQYFSLKILLELFMVLALLYVLLLPVLILLISVIVLVLLLELLLLRRHLLLLLKLIILIRWQPTHHLHFKSLLFHQELILRDLLVDLGFKVLFFAVYKAHVVIFLHQVHIVNIKCLNLINIHLRVLLQIIIIIILPIDVLV